ncbi:MAG: sodium:alanine symporter family protein [Bifidobacteriaceae bacterium]|nr:sodium:alanine symporter family protein [Bifidobacteriaceae bacterium]
MNWLNDAINFIDGYVWSAQLLIPLLFITGFWLTFRLHGVQFSKLWPALKLALFKRKDPGSEGDISHYQALTTALAATVGVGNIVGVASAITIGGPGALFWMWVTGVLGMASKYSEAFLGSKYRETDAKGEVMGGPQVYLEKAIKGKGGKVLAVVFAIFGALAAFGIGNGTQVNSVGNNLNNAFGVPHWVTAVVMFALVGLVLIGGIKVIGTVTAAFVPFMIVVYIGAGIVVLAINGSRILPAFGLVFSNAFTVTSAGGGAIGATIALAIQKGMARGIFSNESGMGSAAIVAAAAKTTHPVRQGLVSMTQTFIDTIIVVTFTGLCILTTDVWKWKADDAIAAGEVTAKSDFAGEQATSYAFGETLGTSVGPKIVAICVVFFALSTVIGWSYYGERCAVRLLGIKAQLPYRVIFTVMVLVWGLLKELTARLDTSAADATDTAIKIVWNTADILNGLMALPNLIGLLILSGLIARETKAYLAQDPDLTKGGVDPEPLMSLDISWVPAPEEVAKK